MILNLKFISNSSNPRYKRKAIEYVINKETQCWEVISHPSDKDGYRLITVNNKIYKIHRLTLEEKLNRKLEKHEVAMHTCDNPSCCNPNHLTAGTIQDNNHDKIKKGRSKNLKGSELPQSIINERIAEEIKYKLINGIDAQSIAKEYNINICVVQDIRSVRNWKHVAEHLNDDLIKLNDSCGKGINHYNSLFKSEEDIKEIKRLLKEGNMLQKDIAKMFNVSHKIISKINRGKIYKEVAI